MRVGRGMLLCGVCACVRVRVCVCVVCAVCVCVVGVREPKMINEEIESKQLCSTAKCKGVFPSSSI